MPEILANFAQTALLVQVLAVQRELTLLVAARGSFGFFEGEKNGNDH